MTTADPVRTTRIAGIEVGMPASIDEVTAEWMTKVLRASGAITDSTTVTTLAAEPFAVGVGLLSQLYRAALQLDGGPGPDTVIVKFPTDIEHQRAIADAFNIYAREVTAYTSIVPRTNLRTPTIYAAMIADDVSNCCIVMEDLSRLDRADGDAGATWEQAINAVDALAGYHASFFGSDELPALSDPFITFENPIHGAALPGVHAAGWPATKEHAPDLLTPEVIAFGDRWAELLPEMLSVASRDPTMLHGDWRTDNMFFDGNGDVVIFDFQISAIGNGAYDLAYFISQSLERPARQGREREIVQRYVDQLATHGVERDVDHVMSQVRALSAFCLMYGFASFPQYTELPPESQAMTRQLMRRAVETITDLDGIAAVDAL